MIKIDYDTDKDLLKPVTNVKIVNRDDLKPNNYNPNKVTQQNLDLLLQSILKNGWTMPIVIRPDNTIIDGFHRWHLAGQEPLNSMLNGKVPVVIVEHDNEKDDIMGTITHNRARGQHLLEPMRAIINGMINDGMKVHDIARELQMRPEEVFRLSGLTRNEFLRVITTKSEYSKAEYITES